MDNLVGVIGKLNIENIEFRASRYNGNIALDLKSINQLQDILEDFNFSQSAASLTTQGSAYADQFGVIYDNLDYFFRGEWVKIKTQLDIIPIIQSYYLTVGYNDAPFTYHLTFADSDVEINANQNEIPIGANEELDKLAQAYNSVFAESAPDSLKTWTLGIRWDVLPNLALKAEVSALEGDEVSNSFFVIPEDVSFNRKTNLYLIGLDWVF